MQQLKKISITAKDFSFFFFFSFSYLRSVTILPFLLSPTHSFHISSKGKEKAVPVRVPITQHFANGFSFFVRKGKESESAISSRVELCF